MEVKVRRQKEWNNCKLVILREGGSSGWTSGRRYSSRNTDPTYLIQFNTVDLILFIFRFLQPLLYPSPASELVVKGRKKIKFGRQVGKEREKEEREESKNQSEQVSHRCLINEFWFNQCEKEEKKMSI